MKHLFSVAIFIIAGNWAMGQVNDIESFSNNSFDKRIIKENKIDTIYAYKNSENNESTFVFIFNASGNIVTAFDTEQNPSVNAYVYSYDNKGKHSSIAHYKITDGVETLVDSVVYTYDKSELLEKTVKIILPNNKIVTTYKYNNQKLTEAITDMNGNKMIKQYKYNNKGQVTNFEDLYLEEPSKKETIITKQTYSYNAAGKILLQTESAGLFALITDVDTTRYTYYDDNKLASTKKTDGSYSYYTYNEQGLLDKKEYYARGALASEIYGSETFIYIKKE